MKAVWVCIASLIGSSLIAENVHNLEFHFPPSRYEWQPLLDENQHLFPDDDDDEEETSVGPEIKMKVFTHREGDAFECFVSFFTEKQEKTEIDEDEDDLDERLTNREQFYQFINSYLKNHQFRTVSQETIDGEEYVEWEFVNGFQDLIHGYSRSIETDQGMYSLGYFTTALRNEYNRSIWMDVLSKATICE